MLMHQAIIRRMDLAAGPTAIIAPHPDDEMIGCGGWLILTRGIAPRTVVYLSSGEGLRQLERQTAHEGLHTIAFDLNLDEGHPERWAEREVQHRILEILTQSNPRYLFVPNRFDVHPDHRATHRLLHGVLRQNPRTSNMTILQYEGFQPLGHANWWLNISRVAREKFERLRMYKSQDRRYDISGVARALSRYRGKTLFRSAIEFAEAYTCETQEEYLACQSY